MKANDKKGGDGLDVVTPLVEMVHHLGILLIKGIIFGIKEIFKLSGKNNYRLTRIDEEELRLKKVSVAPESMGIDSKSKKELKLTEIDFRRHSFIVGASGFGKTNLISLLQENALRQNKPIIFFDPKGDQEALQTFKSLCEEYKKPCYIFSEHYPESIKMNPFLEGTINQVVDRIMSAYIWENEFYKEYARSSLFKVLEKLERNDLDFSLKSILDELILIQDKDNIGLVNKLLSIQKSDFAPLLKGSREDYTLSKIREERACLYIGLSTQGYGETAKAVGKLFLGELLHNSYTTLRSQQLKAGLRNPMSVYFDEFGSLVTDQFIELLNKCRGAGIEITMAVQTPSDIDKLNKELTLQIIENSGNLFILKQRLSAGASLFSEAIGTIKSKKQTLRFEEGETQNLGSEREVHELLVHPDLIKNLGVGQCVLLRQGPTRLNLINIRERKFSPKVVEAKKSHPAKRAFQ